MEDKNKYFINGQQVSKQAYMEAERDAGFHPKTEGNLATASFSSGKVSGHVEYG